jgi:2-keto-4-pentenoate hydratase/2-oxohepta-3-ene-1,7-dioic acid hydratase in catechol pathway
MPRLGVGVGDAFVDMETLFQAAGQGVPDVVLSADLKKIAAAPDAIVTYLNDFMHHNRHAWEELERELPADVKILPPIPAPDKIICIGLNYLDHCEEQGKEPPTTPVIFAKFANSVAGHNDDIIKPRITEKLDFEGELAVIMGLGGRSIPRDEALSRVFGYTVAHDVSARDIQKADGQWLRAKGQDTFFPFGPCVVTADELTDPQALDIKTWLNGELMQSSNTRKMTFTVAHLVEFISQGITLGPGDVISTGTPAGVGVHRKPPVLLKHGDKVEIEIERIGRLTNSISDEA